LAPLADQWRDRGADVDEAGVGDAPAERLARIDQAVGGGPERTGRRDGIQDAGQLPAETFVHIRHRRSPPGGHTCSPPNLPWRGHQARSRGDLARAPCSFVNRRLLATDTNPCWSLGGLRGEEKLFARAHRRTAARYGRAVFRRGHLAMNLTVALLVHQRAAIRYGG